MAGLELLFSAVQSQIKCPSDVAVCCFHWAIIRQGTKCIGTGDQIPEDVAARAKTEMLPAGWNDTQDVYSLMYASNDNKVYALKVLRMDSVLMVHLMRMNDEFLADVSVEVSRYITEDLSSFSSTFTNQSELESLFKKEVLDKVFKTSSATSSSSASSRQDRSDRPSHPEHVDPLRVPPRRPQAAGPHWGDPVDPFSIGRGDLDPLAAGMGGGMVFDPLRSGHPRRGIDPGSGIPGGLPPGAVPPGARFDPFGPPGIDPRGGRSGPDPDHLPPPGFDDMFM